VGSCPLALVAGGTERCAASPRRAVCSGCAKTDLLLPAVWLARRADAAAVSVLGRSAACSPTFLLALDPEASGLLPMGSVFADAVEVLGRAAAASVVRSSPIPPWEFASRATGGLLLASAGGLGGLGDGHGEQHELTLGRRLLAGEAFDLDRFDSSARATLAGAAPPAPRTPAHRRRPDRSRPAPPAAYPHSSLGRSACLIRRQSTTPGTVRRSATAGVPGSPPQLRPVPFTDR